MKKFVSLNKFSSYYNDDVWGRIFRFNKCSKAFKYISFSTLPKIKRRYQRVFRINPNFYFKRTKSPIPFRNPANLFGLRLKNRHKLQYFYGKFTKREFRVLLFGTKGKVGYSRVDYLYNLFESRVDILMFRAGWFTNTLAPFQTAYHRFACINGRVVKTPFDRVKIGQFVTLAESVFDTYDLVRRIKSRAFVSPIFSIFSSEFLPVFILAKPFIFKYVKIFPSVNHFEILKYSYLKFSKMLWLLNEMCPARRV